jgi:hypothetical protein
MVLILKEGRCKSYGVMVTKISKESVGGQVGVQFCKPQNSTVNGSMQHRPGKAVGISMPSHLGSVAMLAEPNKATGVEFFKSFGAHSLTQ